jgi:hypothetical protein
MENAPASTAPATRAASAGRDETARPLALWPSIVAGVCCGLVALLACAPGVRAQGGDNAALLFLALCAGVAFFSPLSRVFFPTEEDHEPTARNASTFALLCALSILFPLARNFAPFKSLVISFADRGPTLADVDPIPISAATVLVIVGALATAPSVWRACSGVVRASALALAMVAALGLFAFELLSRFYPVGVVDKVVDPSPLILLLVQSVEWGALVLLAHAAVAHPLARRWVLRALPLVLLLVWARHFFAAPPPVEEDEE